MNVTIQGRVQVEYMDGAPTKKKRKYKHDSKASAEDVKRRKRNRARSDRRRRARKRLMAAEEKARTRLQGRGGAKSWKQAVKRRYSRDLRLNKQRRKRRQED